jgi:hypothetical protein
MKQCVILCIFSFWFGLLAFMKNDMGKRGVPVDDLLHTSRFRYLGDVKGVVDDSRRLE